MCDPWNKLKVLSTNKAKLSIPFSSKAAQMVWCHVVSELSALVILRMDWLTQVNPNINWSQITIEWTSNDINVFLEACDLGRTRDNAGYLNLIGMQQVNDMVLTTKGKNLCAWVVQSTTHSILNAAELKEIKCPNAM